MADKIKMVIATAEVNKDFFEEFIRKLATISEKKVEFIDLMPEADEPDGAAEAPKKEPAPEISVADLRSKVVKLAQAGKAEAARTVVKSYADNVSGVPGDKRTEVYKKLQEIEEDM